MSGALHKPSTKEVENELQRAAHAASKGDNMAAVHHGHRTLDAIDRQLRPLVAAGPADYSSLGRGLPRGKNAVMTLQRASARGVRLRAAGAVLQLPRARDTSSRGQRVQQRAAGVHL